MVDLLRHKQQHLLHTKAQARNFLLGEQKIEHILQQRGVSLKPQYKDQQQLHVYDTLRFVQTSNKHSNTDKKTAIVSMGNEAYTEEYLDDGDSSPLIKVKRNVLLNRGKVRDLYHGAVNQSENDVFKMKSRIRSNKAEHLTGLPIANFREISQRQQVQQLDKVKPFHPHQTRKVVTDATHSQTLRDTMSKLALQQQHQQSRNMDYQDLDSLSQLDILKQDMLKLDNSHTMRDQKQQYTQLPIKKHTFGAFYSTYSSKLNLRTQMLSHNVSHNEMPLNMNVSLDQVPVDISLPLKFKNSSKAISNNKTLPLMNASSAKKEVQMMSASQLYGANIADLTHQSAPYRQANQQASIEHSRLLDSKKASTCALEASQMSHDSQNQHKLIFVNDNHVSDINIKVYNQKPSAATHSWYLNIGDHSTHKPTANSSRPPRNLLSAITLNDHSGLTSHRLSFRPVQQQQQQDSSLLYTQQSRLSNKFKHKNHGATSQYDKYVQKKQADYEKNCTYDIVDIKNQAFHTFSQARELQSEKESEESNGQEGQEKQFRHSRVPYAMKIQREKEMEEAARVQEMEKKNISFENKAKSDKRLNDTRNTPRKVYQKTQDLTQLRGAKVSKLEKQLRQWLYGHYHIKLQKQIQVSKDLPGYGFATKYTNQQQQNATQRYSNNKLNNQTYFQSTQRLEPTDMHLISHDLQQRRKSTLEYRQPPLINVGEGELKSQDDTEALKMRGNNNQIGSISSDDLRKHQKQLSIRDYGIHSHFDPNMYIQKDFQIFDHPQAANRSSHTPRTFHKHQTDIYASERVLDQPLLTTDPAYSNAQHQKPAITQSQWLSPFQRRKMISYRMKLLVEHNKERNIVYTGKAPPQQAQQTVVEPEGEVMASGGMSSIQPSARDDTSARQFEAKCEKIKLRQKKLRRNIDTAFKANRKEKAKVISQRSPHFRDRSMQINPSGLARLSRNKDLDITSPINAIEEDARKIVYHRVIGDQK